ncbi:head completion/stabilization protein [Sphingomonas jatrophae]|uniref:Phage head completion protein (GPL) n=1 Tax=Sphingomonas jatrophae TaxID=1166337 RepID=A0A1I6JLH0_9SPHN|nr:head completion/stabilization protein [Sphingomonas jatrophae]SFR79823.1 Phage head completion protein (GPL) [Sphingomonas jatrophae]
MSTTIVGCPTVIVPPAPAAEPKIAGGWWPDIDPGSIREQLRVRDAVTSSRLREALLGAMVTVHRELRSWRAGHEAAGHASLAAVPADELGDESELVILYRRAIGAYAKAELVERQRDTDLTGAGQRQVADLDQTPGELRRDALHAIRDMLGVSRTDVELI